MSFPHHSRVVNPRLGAYFGIFTSALLGLVVLLLVFEQLGIESQTLRVAMLLGPIALYLAIGAAALTQSPIEYFAAGRRVPAAYCGLGLSISALGGTGLLTLPGLMFAIGYDAICIIMGCLGGFTMMAILLAPFFRKFGAFTTPTYLGRRFDSRVLRVIAAAVLAVPMLLVLAAELHVAGFAARLLTAQPHAMSVTFAALVILMAILPGGMRSLTWTGVAQSLLALLAIVGVIGIVGVYLTNLPIPQLSHGPAAKLIWRQEQILGFPTILASDWSFDLPSDTYQAMAKKLVAPFGNIGQVAFITATLSFMAGFAAAPWLLPRIATAPGVYEARKSLGWATVFFGIAVLTLAAVAVFMRSSIMDLAAAHTTTVPDWLKQLVSMRFAEVDAKAATLKAQSVSLNRDTVLFAITVVHGLPAVLLHLLVAAVLAAALASASTAAASLGNVLAEDMFGGLTWETPDSRSRLWLARAGILVALLLASVVAIAAPTDPLRLVLWAVAITGSAAFPVLVLSIWWKRMNAIGAAASILVGFAVAVLAILVGETHIVVFDSPLAGVIGLPASLLTALAVSSLTPPPGRHVLELVRDIRVPGGEILYDRETRLARLRTRQRNRDA